MKTLRFQLFVVIAAAVAVCAIDDEEQLEKDEIIEAVNRDQNLWKAGRNFHPSFKKSYLKNMLNFKNKPEESRLPVLDDDDDEDLELPESFDARQKWSNCVALQTIRNQGPCGSCWAVSIASAFTDRLCIATNASFNEQLSSQQLLSCSKEQGCKGAFSYEAWEYLEEFGIVTGGDYHSNQGCQPYRIPPYYTGNTHTPRCRTYCYNKLYKKHPFKEDHHRVEYAFQIKGIETMKKEIYRNGPIVADFNVYADFEEYKTGVYFHIHGKYQGGHIVKVIGWGVESDTPYWLVANTWGSSWGKHNGFFKIKRGNNECGFEQTMSAGYPYV